MILDQFRALDLTHVLHEGIPTWTGRCGFRLEVKIDYEEGLRAQTLRGHAGVGTHMDAPSHFIPGSWNIGDIPLENLIVPVSVLHLKEKMAPDFFISPQDIEAFERKHGAIRPGSLVLAHTGWDQYWHRVERYRNPDETGRMHFPGFSPEAVELLLKREIVGIGIDTLSPDGSTNGSAYPVHELILGAKKYILENVANLSQMPPTGAQIIALPPRTRDASESAIRLVGLLSH